MGAHRLICRGRSIGPTQEGHTGTHAPLERRISTLTLEVLPQRWQTTLLVVITLTSNPTLEGLIPRKTIYRMGGKGSSNTMSISKSLWGGWQKWRLAIYYPSMMVRWSLLDRLIRGFCAGDNGSIRRHR